jgi:hypothetical protein
MTRGKGRCAQGIAFPGCNRPGEVPAEAPVEDMRDEVGEIMRDLFRATGGCEVNWPSLSPPMTS